MAHDRPRKLELWDKGSDSFVFGIDFQEIPREYREHRVLELLKRYPARDYCWCWPED